METKWPEPEEVAKWLCVGFKRCMTMGQVMDALGLDFRNGATDVEMHEHYGFWPTPGRWMHPTPVRAFFAANFPRLADYMDRNVKDPEKFVRVIPQLVKLKIKGESLRGTVLSQRERYEVNATKKKVRAATTTTRAIRDQRNSTSRSAWSTCKSSKAR